MKNLLQRCVESTGSRIAHYDLVPLLLRSF